MSRPAMVEHLGRRSPITSPTFTLVVQKPPSLARCSLRDVFDEPGAAFQRFERFGQQCPRFVVQASGLPRAISRYPDADLVHVVDVVAHQIQVQLRLRLCVLQFGLRELALGDVLDDAVNPGRVARRVPGELVGHDVDATPRAVPGDDAVVDVEQLIFMDRARRMPS